MSRKRAIPRESKTKSPAFKTRRLFFIALSMGKPLPAVKPSGNLSGRFDLPARSPGRIDFVPAGLYHFSMRGRPSGLCGISFGANCMFLAVVLFSWACVSAPEMDGPLPPSIRVMTFNIRYDEPKDGENAWPRRKEMVAGTLSFFCPDIAGLQEALISQVRDLEALLPDFSWTGVGRDDGREAGEFCPIFYRRGRLRLLDSGNFWLSETPERAGLRGWDAACARVVTWARFKDAGDDSTWMVFNTHFDHVGETARIESARLLRRKVAETADSDRVVVSGDFNCNKDDPAYSILVSAEMSGPVLRDTRAICRRSPYGSSSSFNGFQPDRGNGRLIDHIFVGGSLSVIRWGIISDRWDGRFVSDHNPVLAEIRREYPQPGPGAADRILEDGKSRRVSR